MAFRTQKISQMTPKGANLEATDLIEVSTIESGSYVTRSITGQEIIDAAVGNVDWGDIGGTLSAQTDLQNALDAKVPNSRTLTINGVTQDLSANRTFTISTGITIGSTAIASGTVGRILFEGTGNVVQESGNLFWDNTNGRLGIGTSSPSFGLDVIGTARFALPANNAYGATISTDANGNTTFSKIGTGASLYFTSTQSIFLNPTQRVGVGNFSSVQPRTLLSVVGGDDSAPALGSANGKFSILNGTGTSGGYGLVFGVQGTGMSHIQSQRVDGSATAYALAIQPAGGNVLINTTTDAGFRLDVNGSIRNTGTSGIHTYAIRQFSGGEPLYFINQALTSGPQFSFRNGGTINNATQSVIEITNWSVNTLTGTGQFNAIDLKQSVSTSSSSAIIRGIYYNPTTAISGGAQHFAFHSTSGRIRFENLPTSSAGLLAGDIWNDAGTLKIV